MTGNSWVSDRSQANVLGYVLLAAIVLSVSVTVVVAGGSALQDVQSSTNAESAERTMLELQSKMAQSGSAGATREQISFAQTGDVAGNGEGVGSIDGQKPVSVDSGAGEITVRVDADGDGTWEVDQPTELGAITYREDVQNITYQGGGVFRKAIDSDASTVVSAPSFEYQYRSGTPTLSLGITAIDGGADVDGTTLSVEKSSSRGLLSGLDDPGTLDGSDTIEIEIRSEYYRAWGQVFEERTGVDPEYRHDRKQVSITLEGEKEPVDFRGGGVTGAISTSEDVNTFDSPNHVTYDSYDHRSGENADGAPMYIRGDWDSRNHGTVKGDLIVNGTVDDIESGSDNSWEVTGTTIIGEDLFVRGRPWFNDTVHVSGDLFASPGGGCSGGGDEVNFARDVYVGSDVTCLNNVHISGDLHVQGDLSTTRSSVTVDGDIYVGGTHDSSWDGRVDGTDPASPRSADLPSMSSLTPLISEKGAEYDDDNDNGATVVDLEKESSSDKPCESSTCVLTSGDYYIDGGITLNNQEELELDTTGGPINIYTGPNSNGNGIEINNHAEIVVRGDNPVRVYNNGTYVQNNHGSVQTLAYTGPRSEPDATNFWLYMRPDEDIAFNGNGPFVGTVCAPGTASGELSMGNHFDVYGAVIGDISGTSNHDNIHFDEAILDSSEVCGGNGNGITDGGGNVGTPAGDRVAFVQISKTDINVTDD